uniref:Uncharacterized protein LOC114349175 n=1 Tax=Diabrotica virgifera virgifera TaxID=50390 RepID=A0A6P7H9P2_DIAVI
MNVKDSNAKDFSELLQSFNFAPSILEYTRVSRTSQSCIDNIYTSINVFDAEVVGTYMSDHTAHKVSFTLQISGKLKKVKKRIFSITNKNNFKSMLFSQKWDSVFFTPESLVNEQWDAFVSIVGSTFDYCFPIVSVQQKCTAKKILKPNQQVAACKNELDILLVLSRSDRVYSEAYKTKKQEYNRLLSDARSAHYEERINNSESKSKCVWQIVREINGTVTEYVDQTSNISGKPEDICNNFNKFVLHAGPNLIKTQPQATFSCSIPYNTKLYQ